MEGPVHKRANLTEDGFFVGVQHPMAMVLRKRDMKLMSVSTKKIKVYESAYIGPLGKAVPSIDDYEHAEVCGSEEVKDQVLDPGESKSGGKVHSIKSMRNHTVPPPSTTATQLFRPPTTLDNSAESMSTVPGEGEYVPEHMAYSEDQLASDLQAMKLKVSQSVADPRLRSSVIAGIDKARSAANREIEMGQLKIGKNVKDGDINAENIVSSKRRKVNQKESDLVPNLSTPMVGDMVSAPSTIFDGLNPGSYSKTHPLRCPGVVTKTFKDRKLVQVLWTEDNTKNNVAYSDLRIEKKKVSASMILACMLIEGSKAKFEASDKSTWPLNFFEALVKSDWREWVQAVKKEISSWLDFDAYDEIKYSEKTPGASIVPLGELYTRKRDLQYKFRQYLMENLLKRGKDFYETYSNTVSWDGIRW